MNIYEEDNTEENKSVATYSTKVFGKSIPHSTTCEQYCDFSRIF